MATWYLLEPDGTVLLGPDAARERLNNLRRGPRVSSTALASGDRYTHVSVQGHVTSIRDDEGLRDIDRLAEHYTGQPYQNWERPRVSVHVAFDRWHGWGAARRHVIPVAVVG